MTIGPSVDANLALLADAARQKDNAILQAVFQTITGIKPPRKKKKSELELEHLYDTPVEEPSNEPTVDPRTVAPDLFIVTAETAIQIGQWETAVKCLLQFRSTNPASNQFLCRAHLCQAHIDFHATRGLWGEPFVKQVLAAVESCMKAVRVATSQPAYHFLVHNIAVVYNQVMRPLLKDGYRGTLYDSMVTLDEAMDITPPNQLDVEIRFVHLINLLGCADEVGRSDQVLKAQTKAVALAKQEVKKLPSAICRRLVCSMIQACRADPKKADGATNELATLKAKGEEWCPFGAAVATLQKIRSGFVEEENIRDALDTALGMCGAEMPVPEGTIPTGKKSKRAPKKEKKKKKKKEVDIDEDDGKTIDIEQHGVVADIGRMSIQYKLLDMAKHCATFTLASKQLGLARAWVLSEFTTTEVQVAAKEGDMKFFSDPGVAALKPRLEGIRKLDATLRSATRLGDLETIQAGCVAIWNMALPLLQPTYRDHVGRAFQSASNALESIDSPLYNLRVQFHLELAKIQLDSDFLDQATVELEKAALLDYTVPESVVSETGLQNEALQQARRPYDRYMEPIRNKLRLRSNIYVDPDTAEEKAILQVEQAKDAKTPAMRKNLLGKAIELLNPPLGPYEAPTLVEYTREQRINRALIWADVARLAWDEKLKAPEIATPACAELCDYKWDPVLDRTMVLDQVTALFLRAEIYFHSLSLEGADRAKTQHEVREVLLEAHRKGSELNESWVSINAATQLFNMHLDEMHAMALVEQQLSVGQDTTDLPVTQPLKDAMVELFNGVAELASCPGYLRREFGLALARVLEARGEYEAAIELCEKVFERSGVVDKKALISIYTRAHKRLSREVRPEEDKLTQALIYLEQLRSGLYSTETKTTALEACMAVLLGDEADDSRGKKAKTPKPPKKSAKGAKKGKDDEPPPPKPTAKKEELEELEAEIWSNLALAALCLGDHQASLKAANNCLQPVMNIKHDDNLNATLKELPFGANRWTNYAVAECCSAECLSLLVDPDTQDKKSQDVVRRNALMRFERAARYGLLAVLNTPTSTAPACSEGVAEPNAAPRPPPSSMHAVGDVLSPAAMLVLKCAKQFWNVGVPFMNSASTRQVIQTLVRDLNSHLEGAVASQGALDSLDPSFRSNLYCVALDCIKDDNDLRLGYDSTTQALKFLPSSMGRDVWQQRVYFMGKLGMDVAVGVHQMKASDATAQAKMWSSMAKSCSNQKDQYIFLWKAMDSVSNPVHRVEFIVEYAEWLFVQGFPATDAKDQLLMAADILLDLEPDALDAEQEARANASTIGDGSSVSSRGSRGSRGSKGSRGSSRASGGSRGPSRTHNKSVASHRSQSSRAGSVRSQRSNRTAGRSSRQDGSSRAGSSRVAHPPNEEPEVTELQAKHLLILARIYTTLSQMGETLRERLRYCLAAHSFLERLWATSFEQVNAELCPPVDSLPAAASTGKLDKTKGKTGTSSTTATAPTPLVLPEKAQDWIDFALTKQEVLCKTMRESKSPLVYNSACTDEPEIVVHYLSILANSLVEFGFHLQALPVLCSIEFTARDIIGVRSLETVTHLRISRVLDQLDLTEASMERLQLAEPILPTEQELARLSEVVEQQEQLKAMASAIDEEEKEEKEEKEERAVHFQDKDDEDADDKKLLKTATTISSGKEHTPVQEPIREISGIEARENWLEIAKYLIELGRFSAARFLLAQTKRHCHAFDDQYSGAIAVRLSAVVAQMEGNTEGGLALQFQAQHYGGDVHFWLDATRDTVEAMRHAHRTAGMGGQHVLQNQLDVIRTALGVFQEISQKDKISKLNVTRAVAILKALEARCMVEYESNSHINPDHKFFCRSTKASGPSTNSQLVKEVVGSDTDKLFREMFRAIDESLEKLEDLQDDTNLVDTLRLAARARVQFARQTYVRNPKPSLMSLTPECRASEHLSVAVGYLTRAIEEAGRVVRRVKLPALRQDISLPVCRSLADAKRELAEVHLLIHSQARPLRIYQSLDPDPSDSNVQIGGINLDALQQQILGEMSVEDREAALSEIFFNKYEDVFGASANNRKQVSAPQYALAAASSAVGLACDSTQKARAMLAVAKSLVRSVTLEVEQQEDEERLTSLRSGQGEGGGGEGEVESGNDGADATTVAPPPGLSELDLRSARQEGETIDTGRFSQKSATWSPSELPMNSDQVEQNMLMDWDYSYDRSIWTPKITQKRLQLMKEAAKEAAESRAQTAAPKGRGKGNSSSRKHQEVKEEVEEVPVVDPYEGIIRELKPQHARLVAQAKKMLLEVLRIAVSEDQSDLVKETALEIASLQGTHNPVEVHQYLSLAIAADVRAFATRMFLEAAGDSNPQRIASSRLSVLNASRRHSSSDKTTLKRYGALSITDARTRLRPPTDPDATDYEASGDLDSFVASLSKDFTTQLASVPVGSRLLTLYLDPNGSCLYTVLYEATESVASEDGTPAPSAPPLVSRVVLSDTLRNRLFKLAADWENTKSKLHKKIVIYNAEETDYLESLQEEQDSIIRALSELLQPCFDQALIAPASFDGCPLILVVDQYLFPFPLEALPIFARVSSITRDFSVAMLHRRVSNADAETEVPSKNDKKKKDDKGKGDKGAEGISSMGYVIDPMQEDKSRRMITAFDNVRPEIAQYAQMIGVTGREATPVSGQWQRLLTRNAGFMFVGYELYLSFLTPPEISNLSCAGTKLAVLLSHATNEMSHRRQSKNDNTRRPLSKELDSPYCQSLLLSVRGISTIVCNTVSISANVNTAAFTTFCGGLAEGLTVGEALQAWRVLKEWTPPEVPEPKGKKGKKRSGGSSARSNKSSARGSRPNSGRSKGGSRPGSKRASPRASPRGSPTPPPPKVEPVAFTEDGRKKKIRLYDKYNTIIVGDPTIALFFDS